ncbi:alcohol dehydrogenase catalytic domain-containing protein [Candidatus Aerophobetes bacterium]|nr:alcohol dehydrogenase catalytic domain-containing protein [Candidatus Aerophobetes bacterium]
MKALVYKGVKNLVLEEVETPICPAGGILLRVKACGFCGSDLRTYYSGHTNVNSPWIIGHEVAGEVVEVGKYVDGYKKGNRLVVAPPVYCGICYFCKKKLYYLCENIKELAQHWPGGFADFMAVPPEALRLGNVNIIPEGLSFEEASISEPPSSCINAQEIAQIDKKNTVAIMGAGPIGCFHLQIARARGASKIIIMDILKKRLELAERFSPDVIINNKKENYIKKVLQATDNLGPDVVIVACPSPEAQVDSLKMARKGARVVFFGGLPHGKSKVLLDTNLIHYKALQVLGATTFSPEHNKMALNFIFGGKIEAKKYITHIFPLENFEQAIKVIEKGEALKVVLKP